VKIYTKTGDRGETSLFGGDRVSKDDDRVAAYGDVDELNACLGVARAFVMDDELSAVLGTIQSCLFGVGAELATPIERHATLPSRVVDARDAEGLEAIIDRLEERLPPLKTFILPFGDRGAALLHLSRTVCRRAERSVVTLSRRQRVRDEVLTYLNRLGDLLFVLAREVNRAAGVADIPWVDRSRKE
jgi:cob(I)alamin adenosyltransferase